MADQTKEYEKIDLSNVATEKESLYQGLEHKSTAEHVHIINTEDQKVAIAVEKASPQIVVAIDVIIEKLRNGGRLFYIGT
jgi:N-acetylmuramic acid 6-phosphate etherase